MMMTPLALLAKASGLLANLLEPREMIGHIAHLIVPTLADYCLVDLVDEQRRSRDLAVAHRDPNLEALLPQLRRDDSAWSTVDDGPGTVLRHGRPELIERLSPQHLAARAVDDDEQQLLATLAPRSSLIVPLKARGQLLGTLSLFSSSPGRYGPDDLALAEALAGQLALALDNAHCYKESAEHRRVEAALRENERRFRSLYQAAERQARDFALLDQVRTTLAQHLDLATVIRAVVEAIPQAFGYTQVSLYLLEDACLHLQHQVGYDRVIERIPISDGISGRVARTGQPVLLNDVRSDPAFLGAIEGIVSEICVPLFDQGRIAGILNVESTDGVTLTEADLHLMTAVADQVGVAIGRGRLYDQVLFNEARYRSILNTIGEVIFQTDAKGNLLFLNPAWETITGYTVEASLGHRLIDFVHPDDCPLLLTSLASLLGGAETFCQTTVRYQARQGGWRWLETCAQPAAAADLSGLASLAALAGTLTNVTERTEAAALLRYHFDLENLITTISTQFINLASGELDQAITDALRAIGEFTRVDRGGVYQMAADGQTFTGTYEWFAPGILPAEPSSSPLQIRAPEWYLSQLQRLTTIHVPRVVDLPAEAIVEDNFFERQGIRSLVSIPLAAGRQLLGCVSFATVRQERQWTEEEISLVRIVGEVFSNALERERTERAMRQAIDEAERANRAKSEFLSRISHELRTPLNAILGFAQLLEIDKPQPKQQESIEQILHGGRHLLGLIDEVLDLSRIETGRLYIALEPSSVTMIANESLALIAPLASHHHLVLEPLDATGIELWALADGQRLRQVMLNLLSNAVKFNRPGGRVRLTYQPIEGDRVRILVEDTGLGIAAHQQERLFEPFDRLGAEEKGIEGTGLGMALTKRLVELMNGTIGLSSTLGVGTSIWVDLPAAADPANQPATTTVHLLPPAQPLPLVTLLYIEDNESNIRLVERLLAARGDFARLIVAHRGQEGLWQAAKHRPALILLDLHLPDLAGELVLARLKSNPELASIPVVMISADATPGQAERLLQAGAHAYLTKPIDLGVLLSTIDEALVSDLAASRQVSSSAPLVVTDEP